MKQNKDYLIAISMIGFGVAIVVSAVIADCQSDINCNRKICPPGTYSKNDKTCICVKPE